MKKIRLKHDMYISGWGRIPQGTSYKVTKYNKRFVYVMLNAGCELRLARKADCEIVY